MRRIQVLAFTSLDGVVQAPGGPQEDTRGGFGHGGWVVPYFDEVLGARMGEELARPFDLLLGRRTYEIFASYWPHVTDGSGATINAARKYVATHSPLSTDWRGTAVRMQDDVVSAVRELVQGDGPPLQVHGSATLIQTLLAADLVDELWLKVFPVTIGAGLRLFAEGARPARFTLEHSAVTPRGVVIAQYQRAGALSTGTFVG